MHNTDSLVGKPLSPKRFHHVALNVTDIERSVQFYVTVVGLRLIESDDHQARLSLGRAELALFRLPDGLLPTEAPPDHTASALNHIAFEVDPGGFEELCRRIRESQTRITFGPAKRRNNDTVYFLDPDGNKLEIVSPNR